MSEVQAMRQSPRPSFHARASAQIKSLKDQISQKDQELSNVQRKVAALTVAKNGKWCL